MAQGDAALQNQRPEEAARAFAAAATLFPDDPNASRMVKQLDTLLDGIKTNQAAYLRFMVQGTLALRADAPVRRCAHDFPPAARLPFVAAGRVVRGKAARTPPRKLRVTRRARSSGRARSSR